MKIHYDGYKSASYRLPTPIKWEIVGMYIVGKRQIPTFAMVDFMIDDIGPIPPFITKYIFILEKDAVWHSTSPSSSSTLGQYRPLYIPKYLSNLENKVRYCVHLHLLLPRRQHWVNTVLYGKFLSILENKVRYCIRLHLLLPRKHWVDTALYGKIPL